VVKKGGGDPRHTVHAGVPHPSERERINIMETPTRQNLAARQGPRRGGTADRDARARGSTRVWRTTAWSI
jgi:hypothetical protein